MSTLAEKETNPGEDDIVVLDRYGQFLAVVNYSDDQSGKPLEWRYPARKRLNYRTTTWKKITSRTILKAQMIFSQIFQM
jgi:hypothetical protein